MTGDNDTATEVERLRAEVSKLRQREIEELRSSLASAREREEQYRSAVDHYRGEAQRNAELGRKIHTESAEQIKGLELEIARLQGQINAMRQQVARRN